MESIADLVTRQMEKIEMIDKSPSRRFWTEEEQSQVDILLKKNMKKTLDKSECKLMVDLHNKVQNSISNSIITMCKVFPGDFQLNYNDVFDCRDFGKCMVRKADLNWILENGERNNAFENLYYGLALNFNGENYSKYDCMYVLEIKIPKFAARMPVNMDYCTGNYIYKEDDEPYTGFGFTKSEKGVPEFYISITNKSEKRGNVLNEEGKFVPRSDFFPLSEFDISIYRASKESKTLSKPVAKYNSEYFEDQGHLFEAFDVLDNSILQ